MCVSSMTTMKCTKNERKSRKWKNGLITLEHENVGRGSNHEKNDAYLTCGKVVRHTEIHYVGAK